MTHPLAKQWFARVSLSGVGVAGTDRWCNTHPRASDETTSMLEALT